MHVSATTRALIFRLASRTWYTSAFLLLTAPPVYLGTQLRPQGVVAGVGVGGVRRPPGLIKEVGKPRPATRPGIACGCGGGTILLEPPATHARVSAAKSACQRQALVDVPCMAPLTTCTLTTPLLLAAIQTRTLPGNFEVGKRPELVSACSLVGAHTRSFLLLKIPFTVKIFSSLKRTRSRSFLVKFCNTHRAKHFRFRFCPSERRGVFLFL